MIQKPGNELRPRLLAHLQHRHKGKEKAVCSRALEARFCVCGATIRRAVQLLRCEGHPICSGATGYFYARSLPEVRQTARLFEKRLVSAAKIKSALECAMCRMPDTGQTRLEDEA